MGRTEKSQGLAPPAIRKDIRAKQARHIINKTIPAILASYPRARRGADGSELIVDPEPTQPVNAATKEPQGGEEIQYVKLKGQGRRKVKNGDEEGIIRAWHEKDNTGRGKSKSKRSKVSLKDDGTNFSITSTFTPPIAKIEKKIRIVTTDTLKAAHMLAFPSKYSTAPEVPGKNPKKSPNVCILNMASPLRPGGGVLSGATSQEEFLCARTTLLSSLKESFYRLPETGGIYTHDVLVFRDSGPLGHSKGHLGPGERYWIDVISAGMLRFPELEGEEDEVKRLSKKDRDLVEAKMRAVLRIACHKGTKKIVLGAWGCGAYGNPVSDIAKAWKKVLTGDVGGGGKNRSILGVDCWDTIDEIIFAITNAKMAAGFAKAFQRDIEVETEPGTVDKDEGEDEGRADDGITEELRNKIQEIESQLSKVWNPDLKARMGVILDGLKAQLKEREDGADGPGEEEDYEDDDLESDQGEGNAEDEQSTSVDSEGEDENEGIEVSDGGEDALGVGLKLPVSR